MRSIGLLCCGSTLAFILGCDDYSGSQVSSARHANKRQTEDALMTEYARQLEEGARQQRKMEEQNEQYEALLQKWNEQNERYDAVLEKWESQARRTDAILGRWERLTSALETRNEKRGPLGVVDSPHEE